MRKWTIAGVAVAGASALAVTLSGGAANAYPPGNHMRVTVTPRPAGNLSRIVATASNVKPGCTVVFQTANRGKLRAVADSSGVASVSFYLRGDAQQERLTATATKCTAPEKAATMYWLAGFNIHAPQSPKAGKPFPIKAVHFKPNHKVTITAQKGNKTVSYTVTADSTGEAVHDFTLGKGTWAITAAMGGSSVSITIVVS